jgi:hypothetical protein
MITPTKGVRPERSLIYVAGQILQDLDAARTVSGAWEALGRRRTEETQPAITFDWFVLALDLLRAMQVVDLRDGLLARLAKP